MNYTDFNAFNCAPHGVRQMIVRGDNGTVGRIPLPEAMLAPTGPKLYSFLALSDVHITAAEGTDADADFIRAMTYANESDVAFTCICGDVCDGGTEWILGRYAALKAQYAAKPVRAITGNHDVHVYPNDVSEDVRAILKDRYGDPLYYTFTHGDDVFIMLGEYGWKTNPPFADGELEWLQERLEENRDKRCFVFFHVFNQDEGDSGQPTDSFYDFDIYALSEQNAAQKETFLNLLRRYKNTVWFHGHSHAAFGLQSLKESTVYSEACGYRSVHIPSLSKPRTVVGDKTAEDPSGSQGYVVDVYADGIVLRGLDFVGGTFLPTATYRLDTGAAQTDDADM